MKLTLVGVYLDTRINEEDFAITPYLSVFYAKNKGVLVTGLGLTWGWWALGLGIGNNLPKGIKRFRTKTLRNNPTKQE